MLPASHKCQRFTLPSLTRHTFPPGLGCWVKVSAQALPDSSLQSHPPPGPAAAYIPSGTGGLISRSLGKARQSWAQLVWLKCPSRMAVASWAAVLGRTQSKDLSVKGR